MKTIIAMLLLSLPAHATVYKRDVDRWNAQVEEAEPEEPKLTMCADHTYVRGDKCYMCPDHTYVNHPNCKMGHDGKYY